MISKEFLNTVRGKLSVPIYAGQMMETRLAYTAARYVSEDGRHVVDTYLSVLGELVYREGFTGDGSLSIVWSETKPVKGEQVL